MIKKEISPAKKGMNRDVHPSELQKDEYSFALNTNFQDEHGSGQIVLQNEPSNIKCSGFKSGYKVIGHKFDINADRTYFFLTNADTGCSEIGYIDSLSSINGLEQVEAECGCNIQVVLENPLEGTVQEAVCTYHTLMSDCCEGLVESDGCLNFNINFPIKQGNIEIKDEKIGKVLYWTDNYNPPRYLKVDHVDNYYIDEDLCEGTEEKVCLQCEKLRIFPLFNKPCITPEVIQIGGVLRAGTYEAYIAYSDESGNVASNFYSFTNPVSIFDKNNTILDQTVLDYQTTQAISISVDDIDQSYDFFTIVVGYRSGLDSAAVYKIYGTYPISTNKVSIVDLEDKQRIDLRDVLNRKPSYTKVGGLTNVNGYLFQYNLEQAREINLQPVVNLMGAFVKWQTVLADENLYEDGVACAKYKAYMRDEVYPLSIKFFMEGGYESPNFVFIPRPPYAPEIAIISPSDLNYQSVVEAAPDCAEIGRDKVWQFENTADIDSVDRCLLPSTPGVDEGTPVIEEVEYICTVSDGTGAEIVVDTVPTGEVSVITNLGLIDLINNNIDAIIASDPPFDGAEWDDIRNVLASTYPELLCDPSFGEHCDQEGITLVDVLIYAIEASTIEEQSELIDPNVDPESYPPADPPPSCANRMFFPDIEDPEVYLEDTNYSCTAATVYRRINGMPNLAPTSAQTIPTLTSPQISNSNYLVNGVATTSAALQTTIDALEDIPNGYTNKLHTNAIWYKSPFGSESFIIVEMTPQTCTVPDDNNGSTVRITVFDGDTSLPVSSYDVVVTNLNQTNYFLFDATDFPSGEVLIAIDSPIKTWGAECFTLQPPCGCFSLYRRELLFTKTIVFTNLDFGKRMTYVTECTFVTPIIKGCDPLPYENGEFAYWESAEKYPCNPELYNSAILEIKESDLSELSSDEVSKFEQYYTSGSVLGVYTLTTEANFMDKPIRHYKFPDNRVSPFMSLDINKPKPFANSAIYPIGFHIDNKVINTFLNIAVSNGLLTQEERLKINRYEVFRGDRRTDKSVIAKGLLFDTYEYRDKDAGGNERVLYPNYSLNTLGKDFFNGPNHPYNSIRNKSFTFHSPEIHYYKPTLPNEMNVEAYMYGKSQTYFDEVKDYPRYVILGEALTSLATTLAVAEVVLDITSQVLNWIVDATAAGTYPGVILSLASAILGAVSLTINGMMKAGELRQKWIDIFTNLGYPENFAYYWASVGHYGYLVPNNALSSHKYRGIQIRGYLKDGNWEFPNEFNGDTVRVNNLRREDSVFLSLGKDSYMLNYPSDYINYDNYSSNPGNASRFPYLGVGRSQKIIKNVASPYVGLKQFLPSQYGSINAIEWVNTGYCGFLDEDNYCAPIFGGDIFISRFAVKKKLPFFIADAFGQADLTPFQHSFYFNIIPVNNSPEATANGRYFVDYLINDESSFYTSLYTFPTNDTVYNLYPAPPTDAFYIKPPSKFYVYAYGFPYFLAESQFNSNFRYGKPGMENNFYPNFKDVIEYTQEKNLSIREPNTYYYNTVYSLSPTRNPWRMLPTTYKRELYDRVTEGQNRVIFSRRDVSETSLIDPWLIYRGADFYDFPAAYGDLVAIDDLGSEQALGRFTNGYTIYGAVDVLADRLQPETRNLGAGGIFVGRNINFNQSELGYAGTQHTQIISCDFGHFWVDSKRGKVFQMKPGGQGLEEITLGLEKWFKENLPFKILSFFPSLDIDNNYRGVGISMGWDDRMRRLFVTKLDYNYIGSGLELEDQVFYETVEGICMSITFPEDLGIYEATLVENGTFNGFPKYDVTFEESVIGYVIWSTANSRWEVWENFDPVLGGSCVNCCTETQNPYWFAEELLGLWLSTCDELTPPTFSIRSTFICDIRQEVELGDPRYFEPCHWTVAYSPLTKSWISYYSFTPNYYVNYHNYFQTGINAFGSEFGLWSHFSFLSSYQVFYGNLYPFTVEYSTHTKYTDSVLHAVEYWLDVRKYYNKYDFADVYGVGFNKAIVYNMHQNSGQLNLVHQKNNDMRQALQYPRYNAASTDILQSEINGKWSFNGFYNLIKNERSGLPIWLYDCAQINKYVDHRLLDYRSTYKDRLRGDYFLVRLTQDLESRFKFLFKFGVDKRNYYE
jgi:hypothetical protein